MAIGTGRIARVLEQFSIMFPQHFIAGLNIHGGLSAENSHAACAVHHVGKTFYHAIRFSVELIIEKDRGRLTLDADQALEHASHTEPPVDQDQVRNEGGSFKMLPGRLRITGPAAQPPF